MAPNNVLIFGGQTTRQIDRGVKLRGEELEARCVPAKFLWCPDSNNYANQSWNYSGS
jgi:hypothetical protein